MDIAIKSVDFAKCGHINVFLVDGRQITVHINSLYEKGEVSPEVEEILLQMQIRDKVKAIIEATPLSKEVTVDVQRQTVVNALGVSGVTSWR